MNKELFDYFPIEREESSSGGREAEAEGNMWAALIKQAVDCARKNTKLGIQAREWLFSGGRQFCATSLEEVCEDVGLAVSYVRRKAREVLEQKPRPTRNSFYVKSSLKIGS
ncbi:MAG TPA: hypothetical protein VJL09_00070 [Candidatus Paceibacterota bacterium]